MKIYFRKIKDCLACPNCSKTMDDKKKGFRFDICLRLHRILPDRKAQRFPSGMGDILGMWDTVIEIPKDCPLPTDHIDYQQLEELAKGVMSTAFKGDTNGLSDDEIMEYIISDINSFLRAKGITEVAFGLTYAKIDQLCSSFSRTLGVPEDAVREAMDILTKEEVARIAKNEAEEER